MTFRQTRIATLILAVVATLLFDVETAPAAELLVDSVTVDRKPNGRLATFIFSNEVQYTGHTPSSHGTSLIISLRSVSLDRPGNGDLPPGSQPVSWPKGKGLPLSDASLEADDGDIYRLSLNFSRAVQFQVKFSQGRRSVSVLFVEPTKARSDTLFAPRNFADGIKAEPAVFRSSDTPSSRSQVAPYSNAGNVARGPYVLNLASSNVPYESDVALPDDVMHGHRVYNSSFVREGRTYYRLRLGFFPSKKAAQNYAQKLPSKFRRAWVGLASPQEQRNAAGGPGLSVADSLRVLVASPGGSRVARVAPTETKRRPTDRTPAKGRYVLNLASSRQKFKPEDAPRISGNYPHVVYAYPWNRKGITWYRLRIGFFATRKDALNFKKLLPSKYSKAWVGAADRAERVAAPRFAMLQPARRLATLPPASPPETVSSSMALVAPRAAFAGKVGTASRSRISPVQLAALKKDEEGLIAVSPERIEKIWQQARAAMTAKKYSRAVRLYSKLVRLPRHKHTRQSLEYLGLARERNGQLAHAKAEYEKYLKLYPKGEASDRVRQRLLALVTSHAEPSEKLRAEKRVRKKDASETFFYGSFSQYYNYGEHITDAGGRQRNRSQLDNLLDLTVRSVGEKWDVRGQFAGGFSYDLLNKNNPDEFRLSSLYVDLRERPGGFEARLGRQRQSKGGILGRFDGATLGYQILSKVKLGVVGGVPVDSTKDFDYGGDRYFYGVNVELGRFNNSWSVSLFGIQQENAGLVDRRAVGGEFRYFKNRNSIFSLVDYDIFYNQLNIAMLNGNLALSKSTSMNVSLDYRNSPILTTNNAIQGQQVSKLSQLRSRYTDDEIYQLADDRTAANYSGTLGLIQNVTSRFQIGGDVTVTKLDGTPASGGVPANPETGPEYFYSVRFIGSNLLTSGDSTILGFRYAQQDHSNTVSGSLNTRFPITKSWRINPRFRADYRFNQQNGGTRTRLRPSIKTQYRIKRWATLELETGGEWSTEEFTGGQDAAKSTDWYVILGHRLQF